MVLLTSGASISVADHFAMGLKGLKDVTILSENTGGVFSSMMGEKLPNGWEYSYQMKNVYPEIKSVMNLLVFLLMLLQ
ncbi:hypothetical protein EZ456_04125 [Pedobacter psychrodurus]|uniref:Uncharacterized protein n=1 Tax=Pedobacter psychrodurus TaxID=2530456 RepID=A0A4R0QA28_9SPHI|nr:hypothetical protein EZ456_04125 [Pedobacter psychrodurus]